MAFNHKLKVVLCAALLCIVTTTAWAQHKLTGPSNADALDITLQYLTSQRSALGLSEADLQELQVKDRTFNDKFDVTRLYLYQNFQGIEVHNAIINSTVAGDGSLTHVGNRFIADLEEKINTTEPTLTATQALAAVAQDLGIELGAVTIKESASGLDRKMVFNKAGISKQDIPSRLTFLPTQSGDVRLSWSFMIDQVASADYWYIHVDAVTGKVINKHNMTIYDSWDHGMIVSKGKSQRRIAAKRASEPTMAPMPRGGDGSSYYVLPIPVESPIHGDFATANDPADPVASPFGWHDTDGVTGPEFTITRGNNVHAAPDLDGNDISDGTEPDGGQTLTFDLVPDLNLNPDQYVGAATINLFYWNNIMHDVMHHYGLDEAAGNFQELNYTGNGLGSDYVDAFAQSGQGLNNANFSTPPDGGNGRMRMYIWSSDNSFMVTAPSSIAGEYPAGRSSFGDLFATLEGDLELANDGTANPTEACNPLVGFTAGKIAVIDRGSCEFGLKVLNAENAGAIGALIVNNQGDAILNPGPGTQGSLVTVPSFFVGQTNGDTFKATMLQETVSISGTTAFLDGDFDNGIIAHEYGHGISNRFTGGPSNVFCLNNQEQAGEGWSDFYAIALTALETDTPTMPRGVGNYATDQGTSGPGIREFPYSTDMAVNPVTYDKLKDPNIAVPHGVGHTFNTMLWEVYWGLVEEHGFDPDIYNGTGGNNIAINLVSQGMAEQVCSPSFVDARDGILAADLAIYGGANRCIIWRAFAKRGLGFNANGGSSSSITDGTEDFTLPSDCSCIAPSIDEQPQSVIACDGGDVTFSVTVSGTVTYQWQKDGQDLVGETNATLTISGVTDTDVGSYTCIVTNSCDSTTSSNAGLEIVPDVVYSNALLPSWGGEYADPACGDANENGVWDIIDFMEAFVD